MSLKNNLKNLIQEHHLKPNKLMGQHFLIDWVVLQKIIAAADLSKCDTVLEVGPGLGILTVELAKHAGWVIAVEKDKKLAGILKEKFQKIDNIDIIWGDVLKTKLDNLFARHPERSEGSLANGQLSWPNASANKLRGSSPFDKLGVQDDQRLNYQVVANIPYYLTSHLIRKFLEAKNPPQEMILMLQKEVAQRICARPPKMSLLAVSVQYYAQPEIISFVSKKSFWPQPKVDSAIIRITPQATLIPGWHTDDTNKFFKVVRAGFAHPRKQLINNLSRGLKIDRSKIAAALKKIGLEPEQRAESLMIEDWVKLTEILQS